MIDEFVELREYIKGTSDPELKQKFELFRKKFRVTYTKAVLEKEKEDFLEEYRSKCYTMSELMTLTENDYKSLIEDSIQGRILSFSVKGEFYYPKEFFHIDKQIYGLEKVRKLIHNDSYKTIRFLIKPLKEFYSVRPIDLCKYGRSDIVFLYLESSLEYRDKEYITLEEANLIKEIFVEEYKKETS
jgi:hypothetical protein